MTTTSSAKLLVYVHEQLACIKIVGRANFTSSLDFKTLVNELVDKKFTCFLLDLSECVLMDSTFLGVLAGFGLKMTGAANGQRNGHSIVLMNPNPRIAELLENLGVVHLFKVMDGTAELPKGCTLEAAPDTAAPTREEVKVNCKEAHEILMSINPANIPKFKDVTLFLAEDLKKSRTGT